MFFDKWRPGRDYSVPREVLLIFNLKLFHSASQAIKEGLRDEYCEKVCRIVILLFGEEALAPASRKDNPLLVCRFN